MNLQSLSEAHAESILEDIGGWMAGNENLTTGEVVPFLQNYTLSIENVEYWIDQANARKFKIFAQVH